MTTRTVKQAVCDRCGTVISTEDEDAGQIDRNEMTDQWEIASSSEVLADLCGNCVRQLKAWLQSGGAKPGLSHGQGS